MDGSGFPVCSASKYRSTSAFEGSSRVTTLKCKSVCAGHDALIIAAAEVSSDADSGARGCDGMLLAGRRVGSVANAWVDILMDTKETLRGEKKDSTRYKEHRKLIVQSEEKDNCTKGTFYLRPATARPFSSMMEIRRVDLPYLGIRRHHAASQVPN